jgi:hypothetical protein
LARCEITEVPMFKRFIEITFVLSLTFAAPGAQAFFDPPWITPAAPRSDEIVSVNIRDGICDAIFEWPGYPQLTLEGNAIHLIEYGQHWDTADLCVFDIGQLTEPLGVFPPGDYVLTVDFRYEDFLYGPTTMTLGIVPFTVTGTTPSVPIPLLGVSGQFAFLLLISGVAIRALRNRRCSDVQAIR